MALLIGIQHLRVCMQSNLIGAREQNKNENGSLFF